MLAIGFSHLRHRLARRDSGDGRGGRVDPAVYQALTRCTFRLVVLEVGVRRFAEHFELRSMGDDGEVTCFSDSSAGIEQSGILVRPEGGQPFLRLRVAQPSLEAFVAAASEMATTTMLEIESAVTREGWAAAVAAGFAWDRLPRLRRLQLRLDGGEAGGLALLGAMLQSVEASSLPRALRVLDLRHSGLTSVEGLEKLAQLQTLHLPNSQLTSVEGLETLTQLQSLRLDNNQLMSVKGLEKLALLQKLRLDNNQLTSAGGLKKLALLQKLRLDNNQLTSVASLEKLTQLQTLGLSNNQLTSVEGLEKLTQLQWLNLFNNQLTSVEGLEKLAQKELFNKTRSTQIPASAIPPTPLKVLRFPYGCRYGCLIRCPSHVHTDLRRASASTSATSDASHTTRAACWGCC